MKKILAVFLIVSIINLLVGCGPSMININNPPVGESVRIQLIDGSQREGVILKKTDQIIKYVDTETHRPEDLDVSKIQSIIYANKVYDLEGNVISEDQISDEKAITKTMAYGFGGLVLGAAAGFGIGALIAESVPIVYPMAGLGIVGAVYFGIKGSKSDRDDAIDEIRENRYKASQVELKKKLEAEKQRLLKEREEQDKKLKDLKKD